MKKTLKKAGQIASAAVVVSGLMMVPVASMAQAASQKVTLRVAWWGTPDRNTRTLKVIQLFEKDYPNITIQPIYVGWSGYWQKLATEAAGHSLPDVVQMDYGYIDQYVKDHLIVPLDQYVKSGAINLKNAAPSYVDSGKVDGHLYGVNLGANAPSFGEDPSLLAKAHVKPLKPGYTYAQFAQVATTVKKALGNGHYGTEPYDGIQDFTYWLRQKGYHLYNKAGNGLGYTNDNLMTEFFTFWQNLIKKGVAAPPSVTQSISDIQDEMIVHGTEPFIDFWSNQAVAVETSMNHPITLITPPTMPGGRQGEYLKPSMFFSVTRDAQNTSAAVKWINFFTNNIQANEILGAERGVPISSVIRKSLYKDLTPAMKAEFNFVQYVAGHSAPINPPDAPAGGQIQTIFGNIQQEVNYLKITPAVAAKEFRQQATKALEQNP